MNSDSVGALFQYGYVFRSGSKLLEAVFRASNNLDVFAILVDRSGGMLGEDSLDKTDGLGSEADCTLQNVLGCEHSFPHQGR